jgi:SpoIID/LytB domain protein
VALPQQNPDGTVAGWILKGAGWGHGVGMCQRGAQNHALNGWDARRILRHYYTGVEIQKMD